MPQYTGPLPRPSLPRRHQVGLARNGHRITVLLASPSAPASGSSGSGSSATASATDFASWIIPALGFILLPWTTLAYAVMWGVGSDVVSNWKWIVVGGSFLVDVLLWLWVRSSVRK